MPVTRKEIWKDIRDYEGIYEISNFGRVKREKKILKSSKNSMGYYLVSLSKNGKSKTYSIHRLVAETFIPNPSNFSCVNHKDENKENNKLDNLEWCTYQYNTTYRNAIKKRLKTFEKNSKLSIPIIQYDKEENLIKEWKSIRCVEKKLKIDSGSITKVCKGKRLSAGGYVWKYLNV